MDIYTLLINGFLTSLQPQNLLYAGIGVTLGTLVGLLPGIAPSTTVALLLPVTFRLDPTGSLIMFAGIYYGGMYGGSTTSILLNTPGETASIMTTIEGNKMAKAGRAGPALATAAIGSFIAGTVATIGVVVFAPLMVKFAISFGPWDYFGLMLIAFMTISVAFGRSTMRGLTSLVLGLICGVVGIDELTGQSRLDFGVSSLLDGISITTMAVGLFTLGEVFTVAATSDFATPTMNKIKGSILMSSSDFKRSFMPWMRGILYGFPIGTLPAGGAEIPTILSYSTEKKLDKYKEFGKGAIEGVAGPEAANNASSTASLIPLLSLGIPTSATAAVMLAGFQQFGLVPGPQLFINSSSLVWTLIASFFIGNLALLILNLPMIGVWVQILKIKKPFLYSTIMVVATIGTLAVNPSIGELILLVALGVIGYFMRRYDYPLAPMIVGLVLEPMMENQFRRSLQIASGDYLVFFKHYSSLAMLILAALILILPMFFKILRKIDRADD